MLYEDADHSSKGGANSHRGYEYACRDFATIRDNNKKGPENGSDTKRKHHVPSILASVSVSYGRATNVEDLLA